MKQISITSQDGAVRQMWTSDRVADAVIALLQACEVPDDSGTVSREEAEAARKWRITEAGDGKRYFVQMEATIGNWMTVAIADTVHAGEAWIERRLLLDGFLKP